MAVPAPDSLMSALVAETPRALLVSAILAPPTFQVSPASPPWAAASMPGMRNSTVSPHDLAVRLRAPVMAPAFQLPSRVFMRNAVLSAFSVSVPAPIDVLLAASAMPLCAILPSADSAAASTPSTRVRCTGALSSGCRICQPENATLSSRAVICAVRSSASAPAARESVAAPLACAFAVGDRPPARSSWMLSMLSGRCVDRTSAVRDPVSGAASCAVRMPLSCSTTATGLAPGAGSMLAATWSRCTLASTVPSCGAICGANAHSGDCGARAMRTSPVMVGSSSAFETSIFAVARVWPPASFAVRSSASAPWPRRADPPIATPPIGVSSARSSRSTEIVSGKAVPPAFGPSIAVAPHQRLEVAEGDCAALDPAMGRRLADRNRGEVALQIVFQPDVAGLERRGSADFHVIDARAGGAELADGDGDRHAIGPLDIAGDRRLRERNAPDRRHAGRHQQQDRHAEQADDDGGAAAHGLVRSSSQEARLRAKSGGEVYRPGPPPQRRLAAPARGQQDGRVG